MDGRSVHRAVAWWDGMGNWVYREVRVMNRFTTHPGKYGIAVAES
jgi:hypothetical protein